MKISISLLLICILIFSLTACNENKQAVETTTESDSSVIKKRRDDGTLSSMNPVDEKGYLHGVKVNFYEDGLTIHSKVTYQHGRKHGPAIWFFKTGKIYEYTNFYMNRKNGLSSRYYETGELYEEISYDAGKELPGKKKYDKEGKEIPW